MQKSNYSQTAGKLKGLAKGPSLNYVVSLGEGGSKITDFT